MKRASKQERRYIRDALGDPVDARDVVRVLFKGGIVDGFAAFAPKGLPIAEVPYVGVDSPPPLPGEASDFIKVERYKFSGEWEGGYAVYVPEPSSG